MNRSPKARVLLPSGPLQLARANDSTSLSRYMRRDDDFRINWVRGNDFWQTDYDAGTGTWSRTYNLPFTDAKEHRIRFEQDENERVKPKWLAFEDRRMAAFPHLRGRE